ncbi:hypothetical protein Tco_0598726 [Tanacetum coccineum]
MIANVKTTKNKFLMYPRFLQMLVAIETADRTPRPTFGFTRKLFSNMKFKWEGEEIPLTPPMLAIAAAGNDAADDDDAANEDNAAADEAAGSAAEAHPVPHSPPVSPVRELTPERQSASERPPSLSPTPPAQTFSLAEPLVFGPEPRPAGYVDPDVLEPIIFGPQPRPSDFVDPDLEEPVIFGPPPRPDNYIEPADIDNLVSMEDDTIHGGFHEESPVGPNDAPTPTADAAGRAEDPTLLTSLSAKLDRCMGRIDSLETELGTSKKIMGGAILTLVSRVKKLERTVKQLKTARFVGDAPATEGDVDIQDDVDLEGLSRMASEALGHDHPAVPSEDIEEREEEAVPLRRKRSVYRRARTEFNTSAFAQFHAPLSADVLSQAAISESAGPSVGADKGKAPMPDLDIPAEFLAEDAQARKRLEEEQASFTCWFGYSYGWFADPDTVRLVVNLGLKFLLPSTVPQLTAAMDSAGSHHIDEDEQIGMSRVAADPDSDDEVLSEILFRGQYTSGVVLWFGRKLPDERIVIPWVKVELFLISPSSPLSENRRQKSFFYLKELLPHVYREDLLLLRRRMNRREDLGEHKMNVFVSKLEVVSSQELSSCLGLNEWKTVYMFVDKDLSNPVYSGLNDETPHGSQVHTHTFGKLLMRELSAVLVSSACYSSLSVGEDLIKKLGNKPKVRFLNMIAISFFLLMFKVHSADNVPADKFQVGMSVRLSFSWSCSRFLLTEKESAECY